MQTIRCPKCNNDLPGSDDAGGGGGASDAALSCPACGDSLAKETMTPEESLAKRPGSFVLPVASNGKGKPVLQNPVVRNAGFTAPPVMSDSNPAEKVLPLSSQGQEPQFLGAATGAPAALLGAGELPLSRPGAGGTDSGETVAQLEGIAFRDQKTQEGRRLPHYLIRNSGAQMEAIIQRSVLRIRGASGGRALVGWARGFGNMPRQNRPLRVVEELAKGHAACADIHFRVQDQDLYVRFQAASNTRIVYLKWAVAVCTWLLLGPVLLSFYLKAGGAFDSWINDYAQKTNDFHHAGQDRKLFYVTKIKKGASIVDGKKLIENLKKTRMVKLSSPNVFVGLTVPELKTQADANKWVIQSSFSLQMSMAMGGAAAIDDMFGSTIRKGEDDPKGRESSLPKLSDLQYGLPVALEVVPNWISGSQYRAEVLAEEIVEAIAAQHTNLESVALYDIESKYVRKEMRTEIEQPWQRLKKFEYLDTLPASDLLGKIFRPSSVGEIKNAFEAATAKEGPWSVLRLFLADPKGGIFHVGPAALVITVIIGGLFWFLPKQYLNGMCRFLGWPTQDEFENHALAMPARIEGILSDVLLYDFGVQQKDIININPGAPT